MPILTRENLDINPYRYNDWQAFERGKAYYQSERAEVLEFDGGSATCRVFGEHGDYTVVITATSRDRITCSCNCPQAAKARICKHMIASILITRDYIKKNAEKQWEYKLALALEKTPRPTKAKAIQTKKCVVMLALDRSRSGNGQYSFKLMPVRVDAAWPDMEMLAQAESSQVDMPAYLDLNRTWTRYAEAITKPIQESVVNLSPEAVHLCNIMLQATGYYYMYSGLSNYTQYLPLFENLGIPLFLIQDHMFKQRLHVQTTPATIEAALARDKQNYTLQAGMRVNGEIFTTVKDSLQVMQYGSPAWALAGNTIIPIENSESLEMLHYFPIKIPQEDEELFRERYFKLIAERMPIVGDVVSWVDVEAQPVPRLYLTNEEGKLRAALRFGYEDHELDYRPKAPPVTMIDIPGSWGAVRVHRQLEREAAFHAILADSKYGLKRAGASQPGEFELRARVHPFDFLMHHIPAITQAGFEIFGEKNLGRINHNQPVIRLSISSGLDWFDLDAVVQYGDQEVPLREIRKALKKGDKYVKLADGSIGQIPPEWLERYKHLFEMGEETENGLRISDMQLPLVDELLADSEQQDIVPEFYARRERLKSFENIAEQPIPAGFTGELRHYQKSGLDWLHFLREYGFGGILADDMGLGKTIQVLAFLESLREKANGESAASLLVVPKSLLANWQRESAKFTPNIKILEFMGNFRKKDTALFKDYDIVMTTYGTMLRDIEFLREYRFQYAILDESQAVKNPLAQSAKAARLLNAEHRIAMTGTPVENNTFELWSQFAFLNPGLLGNMEYFKREFATPIESHQDEGTAQLLRRMVYPFILRRTKQQVAPELPPRTERLIYTDLEPAQRKLYNHTRDYYRGVLMGLLDEGDVDDVRMKILEGLLRLRQICIHPALVEPTYQGQSAKFEIVLETLQTLQAEGHKALVFSQFVKTLHLLETEMKKLGLNYTYLDGKTQNRQERVDTFQNNPSVSFFLISLKAGGVGLNLTAADYVIHLDPWWNPAVEMQAADRAHRIGQDKPVFIYKYIARDTVEEKILQLQERKKELVDQLISAEGGFFKSITKDDVKALFS